MSSLDSVFPVAIDAFINPFVNRTLNTGSITLGLIGGTAVATAKVVSEVGFPKFDEMSDRGKLLHEFVKGFIVRLIFTGDLMRAGFGGGVYVTAQVMAFVFERTLLTKDNESYLKPVFEAFKLGFVSQSVINQDVQEGLIHGGLKFAIAKTVSLLFKQAIMTQYDLKTDVDYNAYLQSYTRHLDGETVDAFVGGFLRGFLFSANPIAGLSTALIVVTATKICKVTRGYLKENDQQIKEICKGVDQSIRGKCRFVQTTLSSCHTRVSKIFVAARECIPV